MPNVRRQRFCTAPKRGAYKAGERGALEDEWRPGTVSRPSRPQLDLAKWEKRWWCVHEMGKWWWTEVAQLRVVDVSEDMEDKEEKTMPKSRGSSVP